MRKSGAGRVQVPLRPPWRCGGLGLARARRAQHRWALTGRAGPWQDAPVPRAPKLNRQRLRLLTGAAGLVLGEGHPTTQALARAITTWEPGDVTRARAQMRQLDMHMRVLLDDLARRARARA